MAHRMTLNVLPLHHVHGVVNILLCSLWSGAKCKFLPKFKPEKVWQCFVEDGLTLFMAVPTIYHRLIAHYEESSAGVKEVYKKACKQFRLMVSGSAALPVSVLSKWKSISDLVLLERYGMTEIGMALSNSYLNERIAGHVGKPLPKVEIKVVDEAGEVVALGEQGELLIKGPSVFLEYWQKPKETKAAFVNGWFKTGDVVQQNKEGIFRIVGRSSIDIIKTGGYKVSALEIEELIRTHTHIIDCAVVGVPSEEWGQVVMAAIVFKTSTIPSQEELKNWARRHLARYKVPVNWLAVKELPRNAMGKVLKPAVVKLFQ